MEILFSIPKFTLINEVFVKTAHEYYNITFCKGCKKDEIRIVVNRYLTKQYINLTNHKGGYKDRILSAINEYKNYYSFDSTLTNKKINIDYIKENYSKRVFENMKNHLLPINKEESRDVLTKYNLIN